MNTIIKIEIRIVPPTLSLYVFVLVAATSSYTQVSDYIPEKSPTKICF